MLYTDGLVERRGVPLSEGIDELVELLREASSAEDACQLTIIGMVPPEGLGDDVAILTLQSTSVPAELRLELPGDPSVLSRLRRLLRRWLRERGAAEPLVTEVNLAVNEACANAIEHAYPPTRPRSNWKRNAPARRSWSSSATRVIGGPRGAGIVAGD